MKNCIQFYQTSEEMGAEVLKKHCSELISNHWLQAKVNEVDNKGDIPLDLALQSVQKGVAQTLLNNHADVNRKDNAGKSLLHKAIKRGDEFAAKFLITSKADVNMVTFLDKETPLHMVACFNPDVTPPETLTGMADVARLLLEAGADPNVQDTSGSPAAL
nr:hypothetical protein BaRGS_011917 [Batillaria attramentaria]